MVKTATHLPSHSGKITSGRIAERGERITCKSCLRQIENAAKLLPDYVEATLADLRGEFPPAYSDRGIQIESSHAACMASNAAHYANLATFQERT